MQIFNTLTRKKEEFIPQKEGEYRIYGREGEFLCLSRLQGDTMTSLKNFFGA